MSSRIRLPDDREGPTARLCVHTEEGEEVRIYLTANLDASGAVREVFVHTQDRSGWVASLEALAIVISLALQHGAPMATIASKLRGMHGRPCGRVRVPWQAEGYYQATSLQDLLGAWLSWRFPS